MLLIGLLLIAVIPMTIGLIAAAIHDLIYLPRQALKAKYRKHRKYINFHNSIMLPFKELYSFMQVNPKAWELSGAFIESRLGLDRIIPASTLDKFQEAGFCLLYKGKYHVVMQTLNDYKHLIKLLYNTSEMHALQEQRDKEKEQQIMSNKSYIALLEDIQLDINNLKSQADGEIQQAKEIALGVMEGV